MKKEKDFVAANVGQRIKLRRKAKGLTQAKLAELSYISTTYLGEVERGEKSPTLKCFFKKACYSSSLEPQNEQRSYFF